LFQKFLLESIIARGGIVERYAARQARQGNVYTGGTGNCLIDLRWTQSHELKFSSEMTNSGGSDAVFREAVRRLEGRLEWCELAVVNEKLPLERISVRYQFMRAKSHGTNYERLGRRARLLVLRNPFGRMIAGVGLMVFPVLGKGSFILGLQVIGMAVGILHARRGGRSTLYARS
jgi:succinoglycan biosynthesis protein ExoM